MNWEVKQAQILEATKRSLNAERKCVFPPVGDTIRFLEETDEEEFVAVGQFTDDWTLGFERNKEREQYFVEFLASRKSELPEDFGQHSYFVIGGTVFQAQEIFRTESHEDLKQPFFITGMRQTIKFYCSITTRTFTE